MQRIAIVIPMLNEADTLSPLLAGVAKQILSPNEVIFVDAGSTDGSIAMVKNWAIQVCFGEEKVRVIANPGGMPGANRNVGVAAATSEWIAFIDAGIVPQVDWLACLWACVESSHARAVFGECHFEADSAFEKAVCGLSYGCGASMPVLPASIFHRSVFSEIGWFREDLRAAEDLLWIRELDRIYGARVICKEAKVHYRHFPASVAAVARKWFIYQRNLIKVGMCGLNNWLLPAFLGLTALFLITMPIFGICLFSVYVLVRGVLDPMRRSHTLFWWGNRPAAAFMAMWLGFLIDGAKAFAFLFAWRRR